MDIVCHQTLSGQITLPCFCSNFSTTLQASCPHKSNLGEEETEAPLRGDLPKATWPTRGRERTRTAGGRKAAGMRDCALRSPRRPPSSSVGSGRTGQAPASVGELVRDEELRPLWHLSASFSAAKGRG